MPVFKNNNRIKISSKIYLGVLFIIMNNASFSQNTIIDSLKKVIAETKIDSNRIKAYKAWDDQIYRFDKKLDLELNHKIVGLCKLQIEQKKLNEKEKQFYYTTCGNAYNALGLITQSFGEYDSAIHFYDEGIKSYKAVKNDYGINKVALNKGGLYFKQGNFPLAIENYYNSLKYYEHNKNYQGMALVYNNIGVLYKDKGNVQRSIQYYRKSLALYRKVGYKEGIALAVTNVGNYYTEKEIYDSALMCYNEALKLEEEINDLKGKSTALMNIAMIKLYKNKYQEAIELYNRSLNIRIQLNYVEGIAQSELSLGELYNRMGKPKEGIKHCKFSLNAAKEVGLRKAEQNACNCLYFSNKAINNQEQALIYLEKYINIKDSMVSEDVEKEIIQKEFQYEFEKKTEVDSLKHVNEETVREAEREEEIKHETIKKYFIWLGIVIVSIFTLFIFSRFRKTSKQKLIIERQKHEVEMKTKEVMDSIRYAKRIQTALLKKEEHTSKHLPEHFILFKPKDIVSGDFYWSLEKDNFIYLAAADCTGDGVPGALLTMLGTCFLNEINAAENILLPAAILDALREKMIHELALSEKGDGMDISLARYNLKNGELEWAGANNPLWILRTNGKIEEVIADKQSIGFSKELIPFKNHHVPLSSGDQFYLFTDGYANQFGGKETKKLQQNNLKEIFKSFEKFSLGDQKLKLIETFENWRGDMEQVDDICIIGVRVK